MDTQLGKEAEAEICYDLNPVHAVPSKGSFEHLFSLASPLPNSKAEKWADAKERVTSVRYGLPECKNAPRFL